MTANIIPLHADSTVFRSGISITFSRLFALAVVAKVPRNRIWQKQCCMDVYPECPAQAIDLVLLRRRMCIAGADTAFQFFAAVRGRVNNGVSSTRQ
jgi:hypothetical protein